MYKTDIEKIAMMFLAHYLEDNPEYLHVDEFVTDNINGFPDTRVVDVYNEVIKAFDELRVVVKGLAR